MTKRGFLVRGLVCAGLALVLVSCGPRGEAKAPSGDGTPWVVGEEGRSLGYPDSWDARKDLTAPEPFDPSAFKLFSGEATVSSEGGSLQRGAIDLGQSPVVYYSSGASTPVADSSDGNPAPDPQAGADPLQVVDAGPLGELPVENRRPTVYVMFDQPMVPLAALGEPMTTNPVMRVEPAVPGIFRWYGTRALSFEPDAPLSAHPQYTVTIAAGTKALDGSALASEFRFIFHTETIKAVNHFTGGDADAPGPVYNVPVKVARRVVVEFNQEVDPEHLRQFITVKNGNRTLGFKAGRPTYPARIADRARRAILITLDQDPPENTTLTLGLPKGTSPQRGFPMTAADQEITVRTIEPLTLVALDSWSWDVPANPDGKTVPVYARFSHELDTGAAKLSWTLVSDTGKPSVASVEIFGATARVNVAGSEPGMTLTLTAPANLRDIHGRTIRGASRTAELKMPVPMAYLSFPAEDLNHLELGAKANRFVLEGRNVNSLAHAWQKAPGFYGWNGNAGNPAPIDLSAWTRNRAQYRVMDFSPLLPDGSPGTLVGTWTAQLDPKGFYNASAAQQKGKYAIQVTDLGISTRVAYNRVLVWVNSLQTGLPVEGAEVRVFNRNTPAQGLRNGKTDATGLVVFDLEPGEFIRYFNRRSGWERDQWVWISARKGQDLAELPLQDSHYRYNGTVYQVSSPDRVEEPRDRVMLFSDRGLYKAGEEIALRGIHWRVSPQGFSPYHGTYSLELNTPEGDQVWTQSGSTSFSGGLAHRFMLPDDLEPGEYSFLYEAGDETQYLNITVAQFRRLNFSVTSTVADRLFFAGEPVGAGLRAAYLAGGAMPGAPYSYYWTRKLSAWSPPGPQWENWAFGPGNWEGEHTLSNGTGTLSGAGTAQLEESTREQSADGATYWYTVEATVTDVDRQAVASTASVLVHPAALYVGARLKSGADGWWSRFVATKQEQTAEFALVDPRGNAVAEARDLSLQLVRGTWKSSQQQGVYGRMETRWEYVEEVVQEGAAKTGPDGRASWRFTPVEGGTYLLRVDSADRQGRLARTTLRFYATGSDWVHQASEAPETIDLTVDKEEYLPGETARILVQSPLPRGKYLLTVEREGILDQKIIELEGSAQVIEVPVKASYVPVFYVALTAFTKREAMPADHFSPDLGKPRGLFGIVGISVSTRAVELDLAVSALKPSYRPGEKAELVVRVTRDGKPVPNAELTLLAVDRGVLDLINYRVPNPLDYFYSKYSFPHGVVGDDSRRLLMKPVTYNTSSLTGGDAEAGQDKDQRDDFRPLAFFEPSVATDAQGYAKVSFVLPDTLTTYRITALGMRESLLGFREAELLVNNPVNVRAALPRRMRLRDSAAAGVVIHNLTSEVQKITVRAESDILTLGGAQEKTVDVGPGVVYELPFVFAATREGEGTVTFTISSAVLKERLVEKMTVDRPIISEAFTTMGQLTGPDREAKEGLSLSSAVSPGYGGLRIQASTSLRPLVQPALDRLGTTWPWMGLGYRTGVAFAGLVEGQGSAMAQGLMAELAGRQIADGGIYEGTWTWAPYYSSPWLSATTAHLLAFGEARGIKWTRAPDREKLKAYLRQQVKDLGTDYRTSYSVYALALLGDHDPARLKALEAQGDKLGLAGYGLLAQAWLKAGDRSGAQRVYQRAKNFLAIGTRSVDLVETYEARTWWSSGLAELAIHLINAHDLGEPLDLQVRIAQSLNRPGRQWMNRNDDLWSALAFLPFLQEEKDARVLGSLADNLTVYLGDLSIGSFQFTPGEAARTQVYGLDEEPLKGLARDRTHEMRFARTGESPYYYSSTLIYGVPEERARARDEGLGVYQTWETLDGEKVTDQRLKLGETYRVRVHVESPRRRQNLELLVPVPSGVEIVDSRFVTTGRFLTQGGTDSETIRRETVYGDEITVSSEGYAQWDRGAWYWYAYRPEVQVFDSVMAYTWADFYAGSREVSFLVRVTTPGMYPTPPAQASLAFEPEVFGRADGRLFVVEP